MFKLFLILFFIAPYCQLIAADKGGESLNIFLQVPGLDTIDEKDARPEDLLIEEVVKSRTVPKKEKIEYFNQVTKYGFKNLFSNYSYNATLPYTAQINPNAEFFIQDYMRSHGGHLQKMKSWGMPY